MPTIDNLEIEISASSDSAAQKIASLADSLRGLKEAFSEGSIQHLEQLSTALKKLKESSKVTFPSALAKNITAFSTAVNSIDINKTSTVISVLEGFKNLSGTKFSKTIASGLQDVATIVDSMSEQTINRIDRLTASLQRLSGVNLSGISRAAKVANQGNSNLPAVIPSGGANLGDVGLGVSKVDTLSNAFMRLSEAEKKAGASIRNFFLDGLKKTVKPLDAVKEKLGFILNQFKRVLMYRAIRTIIKEIGEAFKTGVNDLYEYSRATEQLADGSFAKSMNDGATAMLYFKNALGASVAPLIMSFISWLDALIDKIVVAINWINQLFAKLTGRDYWYKAKKVATEYAGAAKAAGGAAKEALKYLLPFDELNILPDDKNRGGGGASATPDYAEMFEKMETFDGNFEWIDRLSEKLEGLKEKFNLDGFFSEFKVRIKNLLFEDWTNLSPDEKRNKICDAIFGVAGAIIGWSLGGPAGAVIGLFLGVGLSTLVSRFVAQDTTHMTKQEKALQIVSVIFGLAGAAVGAIYGGPVGAGIGLFLGASLTGIFRRLFFEDQSGLDDNAVAAKLIAGSALTGIFAFTGLVVGGAGGMLIGLTIGAALTFAIANIDFSLDHPSINPLNANDLDMLGYNVDSWIMANNAYQNNNKNKKTVPKSVSKNPALFTSNDNTRIMQELEKLARGYATGGFPEDGLFFANHGELVGKFANGRTAVANNDQIVSGIAQGVEEANEPVVNAIMTAASQIIAHMGKNGVSMDDLARNVTKWQNRNARAMGY